MAIVERQLIAAAMLQDYLADKGTGLALAAGTIHLYKDNNRAEYKNWYKQQGSPNNYTYVPLPNPLTLSAAGTIQDDSGNDVIPFYYPYDEDNSSVVEKYYIEVYDAGGTLQFSRENFPHFNQPESTDDSPTLENIIINSLFWRGGGKDASTGGSDEISINASSLTETVIMPSAHAGFHQPDCRYIKTGTPSSTETITFKHFGLNEPSATSPNLKKDVTPYFYINHKCTAASTGETRKYYQWPISLHLRNLQNERAVFTLQAKSNAGGIYDKISVKILPFLGSDTSPNLDGIQIGQDLDLTSEWNKFEIPFTFEDVSTETLSAAGDDAYYLQLELSAGSNATFDIDFCMPCIYLGDKAATNFYNGYDKIDAVIDSPRTGDFRQSLNSFYPMGWLPANGMTIGKNGSGAQRENTDTWPLYRLLWENVTQTYAPVSSGTRGTSAFADFNAGHTIKITNNLGRVLVGASPVFDFTRTFTVSVTALDINTDDFATSPLRINLGASGTPKQYPSFHVGDPIVFSGGSLPSGLVAGTTYYISSENFQPNDPTNPYISVATSQTNAVRGLLTVNVGSIGSGTVNNSNTDTKLLLSSPTTQVLTAGTPVLIEKSSGGTLPTGLSEDTIYYISTSELTTTTVKLSTNLTDALAGIWDVIITSVGSGTFTLHSADGADVGQSYSTEVLNHTHLLPNEDDSQSLLGSFSPQTDGTAGTTGAAKLPSGSTGGYPKNVPNVSSGSNKPTLMQPSTFANVFIKM